MEEALLRRTWDRRRREPFGPAASPAVGSGRRPAAAPLGSVDATNAATAGSEAASRFGALAARARHRACSTSTLACRTVMLWSSSTWQALSTLGGAGKMGQRGEALISAAGHRTNTGVGSSKYATVRRHGQGTGRPAGGGYWRRGPRIPAAQGSGGPARPRRTFPGAGVALFRLPAFFAPIIAPPLLGHRGRSPGGEARAPL